jgi:alpha-1,2-mannosyltransferase
VIIAIVLWTTGIINVTTPGVVARSGLIKGTDFLQFYVFGSLVREGRHDALYDFSAFNHRLVALVPEAKHIAFVPIYGPQVGLFFAPLAALPYGVALLTWSVLTVLLYGVCCWAVWRACPSLRHEGRRVALLAFAYFPFWNLIWYGQISAIALCCFTLAWIALARGHQLLAGVAIGSLIYKPQLGLAAALVFLLTRHWRVVAGAALAILAQLGLAWAWFGGPVVERYIRRVSQLGRLSQLLEPDPYQLHSLKALFDLAVPWPALAMAGFLITALAAIGLAVRCWMRGASLALRFCVLLLVTVLVSPHVYVYDLVVLAPALLFGGDWVLRHPNHRLSGMVRLLVCASYTLPLVWPAAAVTRLQLSVMAFGALTVVLSQIAVEESPTIHTT